jgi:hypothetical protein
MAISVLVVGRRNFERGRSIQPPTGWRLVDEFFQPLVGELANVAG